MKKDNQSKKRKKSFQKDKRKALLDTKKSQKSSQNLASSLRKMISS